MKSLRLFVVLVILGLVAGSAAGVAYVSSTDSPTVMAEGPFPPPPPPPTGPPDLA